MRKLDLGLALALLLAMLGGPSGALAQRISSPYRFIEGKQDLGLSVSHIFSDPGSARLGPKGGLAYGIEYTRRVSRPLSLTPLLVYFPSERDVIDPSVEEGEGENGSLVVGTTDIDLLLLAGRLNFNLTGARTWHRLSPYLFGGLGLVFDISSSRSCLAQQNHPECQIEPRERLDFGTSFLMQFGLGTVWLPRQHLGLRLEFLNSIWRLKTPVGFYDPGVTIDPVPPPTDWTNNWQVAITLAYWF
jgi:hypothetical protein